jgi:hypothetical protein
MRGNCISLLLRQLILGLAALWDDDENTGSNSWCFAFDSYTFITPYTLHLPINSTEKYTHRQFLL